MKSIATDVQPKSITYSLTRNWSVLLLFFFPKTLEDYYHNNIMYARAATVGNNHTYFCRYYLWC